MNKSDLADYVCEEYLEFGIIGQKISLQATVFLLTWSESYILAFILQPGLSSQASLYFISQGINRLRALEIDWTNHHLQGLAHCPTFYRWGSLIPQVAFASIGSANPRSLQAGAKIGQFLADYLSEGIQLFLIASDKWYPLQTLFCIYHCYH